MTLRDTEVIELLADKPELLAIADAVSATQRKPVRRRRRPVVFRVAVVAAAVVAVAVAVLAAPSSRPVGGILGKALAAVGDGPILHVVTQLPPQGQYIDLQTGRRSVLRLREEFWTDRQLDHFHLVIVLNGRAIGDLLYPDDATKGVSPLTRNASYLALWTGYRTALSDGAATVVGRGTVDGRRVYWLAFKPSIQAPPQARVRNEVAVDARTYKPILYRSYVNGRRFDVRVFVVETLPYRPEEFKRRGPSMAGTGSSEVSGSSEPINPSGPPPAVRSPWLTAGDVVVGQKLTAVSRETFTSHDSGKTASFAGLELTYGPFAADVRATTIEELRRPTDPGEWAYIPAGSIEVQHHTESSSSESLAHPRARTITRTVWTGLLRTHGLYITIRTPKGERALLEIARSLHEGRK